MTYVLIADTLLLALVAVIVVGILRAFGELRIQVQLRNEHPANISPPERGEATLAPVISGETLDRDPQVIAFGGGRPNTLLAFLSSGCLVCHGFWDDLKNDTVPPIPGVGRVVVITKGLHEESPSKLNALKAADEVVLTLSSSQAWSDYSVPGAPYFIYIDGSRGTIVGEGSATQWDQIRSLIVDSQADEQAVTRITTRVHREDDALAAAGISLGHPSLHDPAFPSVSDQDDR